MARPVQQLHREAQTQRGQEQADFRGTGRIKQPPVQTERHGQLTSCRYTSAALRCARLATLWSPNSCISNNGRLHYGNIWRHIASTRNKQWCHDACVASYRVVRAVTPLTASPARHPTKQNKVSNETTSTKKPPLHMCQCDCKVALLRVCWCVHHLLCVCVCVCR